MPKTPLPRSELPQWRQRYDNYHVPPTYEEIKPYLPTIGTVREVMVDSIPLIALTFLAEQAAEALGITHRGLEKQIAAGIIPKAVLYYETLSGYPPAPAYVYLQDEVEAMLLALAEHRLRYKKISRHDEALITKIHDAVYAVRERLGLPHDRNH